MKFLGLLLLALVLAGCAIDRHVEEILFSEGKLQKYAYYDETYGKKYPADADRALFLDALDTLKSGEGGALPDLNDLPFKKKTYKVPGRAYTGLIQNHTDYDISFPAANSGATIIVPARSVTEYITWKSKFQLIGYSRGKPSYAKNIHVEPRKYAFREKKYDFMVEIKPDRPVLKKRPARKHRPKPKVKPATPPLTSDKVA